MLTKSEVLRSANTAKGRHMAKEDTIKPCGCIRMKWADSIPMFVVKQAEDLC